MKNLVTGDLTLASTSDSGVKGNQGSFEPAFSTDASTLAFTSNATNLDAADTDTQLDIYVKELATGEIVLASTSDTGVHGGGVQRDLSADGTRVAFSPARRIWIARPNY